MKGELASFLFVILKLEKVKLEVTNRLANENLEQFQRQKVEDVYIHIPFCHQVCSYCDFCVLQCPDIFKERKSRQAKLIQPYLTALQNEIISIGSFWQQAKQINALKSIYFGGGTPSTLQTEEIAQLINTCKKVFNTAADCEITLELNPNHYSHLDLAYLHSLGLNRISIGMQTSDANLLRFLQREHSYAEVKQAVSAVKQAGIYNYSLDLIIALPGQTLKDVKQDLDLALALAPKHLSIYSLILEAGSKLYWQYEHANCPNMVQGLVLPNEDLEREMMHFATDYLEKQGFRHYEISNFAKTKATESRHNTAVWLARPYFGFGLNASSYLAGVRRTNTKQIKRYIDLWQTNLAFSGNEEINYLSSDLYKAAAFTDVNDEASAMEDYFAFALRYLKGVACQDFVAYFAKDIPANIKAILLWGIKQGLLSKKEPRLSSSKLDLNSSNQAQVDEISKNTVLYVTREGQDYLDVISRQLIGCLSD